MQEPMVSPVTSDSHAYDGDYYNHANQVPIACLIMEVLPVFQGGYLEWLLTIFGSRLWKSSPQAPNKMLPGHQKWLMKINSEDKLENPQRV